MRPGKKRVIYAVLVVGLIFLFFAPIAYVNAGGQLFLFGMPVTPAPAGTCATFGCHCVASGSILGVLLGIGYRQFQGCP